MKNLFKGVFGFVVLSSLVMLFTTITSALPEDNPITPVTPTSESGHATGGVKAVLTNGDNAKLNFNAHYGSVFGQAKYSDSTGVSFSGKVDVCYYQSGNQAVFAGNINSGNVSNQYFIIQVQDNGEGKKATSPDMFSVTTTDSAPVCVLQNNLNATVRTGNLQVHAN